MIEQTKSRPQETIEFKLNKQMETFSFSPPTNLVEEGKLLLAASYFEATNYVFNITDENNSFSIRTLGYWRIPNYLLDRIIDRLKEILELRSQNDTKLHFKEFQKRGNRVKGENRGYSLAYFDHFKSEILAEEKKVKYDDLEGMVCRMELTYDEIMDVLDIKFTSATSIRYTLATGIYEVSENILLLKSLLPNVVKVYITFDDDIRLKSNLITKKTLNFIKKIFFIPY